ncbi:hypothetical protein CMV_009024 [Castanea mollissima]|uniref:Uncharacterized protein n=1 Tax=Castanea mollissima TaxID=60419 RepID=A0A8J4R6C4_9ROSI|nr:hypothetical protein CMV_009024 [Castanea mollissima]
MASASIGGGQKHCELQCKFVIAGLGLVNSDEGVSSTNRLKAFISIAFYGLLKRLKTAAIEVVKLISEALVYVLNRLEEKVILKLKDFSFAYLLVMEDSLSLKNFTSFLQLQSSITLHIW